MKELSITLSIEETNIVLAALSELPYKKSAGIIAKIQQQAKEQLEDNPKPNT